MIKNMHSPNEYYSSFGIFLHIKNALCITYYTKPSQQSSLYMQNNLKCINFCSRQNTLRKGVLSAFNNASPSFIHAHSCFSFSRKRKSVMK